MLSGDGSVLRDGMTETMRDTGGSAGESTLRDRIGAGLRSSRLFMLAEIGIVLAVIAVNMSLGILFGILWFGPLSVVAAVLALCVSLWFRRLDLRAIGLERPRGWIRTILLGVGSWIVVAVLIGGLVQPFVTRLVGEPPQLGLLTAIRGNLSFYLLMLMLSWSTAAFGEEMLFRGYLLPRLADLLGRGRLAWLAALLLQAAVFGAMHAYQGLSGVLVIGSVGLLLGALFLLARRNLWLVILAHGLVDTASLTALYLGLGDLLRDLQ
jgi:membrane protease YdiL (CAAX protease family)